MVTGHSAFQSPYLRSLAQEEANVQVDTGRRRQRQSSCRLGQPGKRKSVPGHVHRWGIDLGCPNRGR
jgi:hypothetical protein